MERISAKEARAYTLNTERLLNRLYKWIKEEAVRNANYIHIDAQAFDNEVLDRALTHLKEDGYQVIESDNDVNDWVIKW